MKTIHSMTCTEWHGLFAHCTASLAEHTRNLAFVQNALASINELKPAPLTPAMNSMFELHAHFFVLELLLNRTPNQSLRLGTFIGYNTQAAISDMQKSIEDIFAKELLHADDPEFWQRITETIPYLRKLMLTEAGVQSYFSNPYYWFWSIWIYPHQNGRSLCLEELHHLQAAHDELGTSLSRYPWLLAQSWMSFFLTRDQEAMSLFMEINKSFNIRPYGLFQLLSAMAETAEWQRLLKWLADSAPLLQNHRTDSLERYFQYWDMAAQHFPHEEQQMWELLVHMLPLTSSIYEEKLLKYGKWRQWVDYQLSTGSDPFDYRAGVFTPFEKNAPEVLLPFYHQAVERYVLLKNRAGYKSAVKLLKRLAKLYKKMKNDAQWEHFITAFSSRHSRLRALQEELRKGKLLS
ncbi:hypothetical protein [Paenibacillus sp. Soil522]|uniref:hypothetical protein n=1 Tax=Paenibacillus sp. Soil522 TaxID=1736388 RepID=UPI0006F4BBA5|nr:hypothetical protein [Paenibacillus sp. Soil522]KRE48105.1 hypothetical protein ASG81_07205 [Paenibacillus sp. Soil522]